MKRIFTLVLSLIIFNAVQSQVVISQIYGGGGNAGAQYRNDFVELFNNSATAVSVAGYSVQYASATGAFTAAQTVTLTGSIPALSYYLVQFGSGGAIGAVLPTPDATGTTNLSATVGKIALLNTATPLASCPTLPLASPVIDFVGYGTTADCFLGAKAPAGSNTTAIFRNGGGTTNTNNNSSDFTAAAPNPRNSAVILPLHLLSFNVSAKNNNTIFNWKTASEINTSHFEIEQSLNGINFNTIATIAAVGNSTVEKSYSYTGSLNNATTYYRLKMVDADGKFTTSAIVKIAASKNGFALGNVYPVPAKNKVTIEWNSNHTGATVITVTDISGRTIRNTNVQAVQGFNQFILDVQSFNAGQYFIRLKNETNQLQTIITRQ